MQTNMDEQIRTRAYELWEADGRPEGRADDYWHRAIFEIVKAESKKAPKRSKTAAPKTEAPKTTTGRRRTTKAA